MHIDRLRDGLSPGGPEAEGDSLYTLDENHAAKQKIDLLTSKTLVSFDNLR